MTPLATVLYEDKMAAGAGGSYPLHDLVMRLVEDDINGLTHKLLRLVDKNPRNGVDKLLDDLKSTDLIAGSGMLFVLVDRDRIAQHLKLPTRAEDAQVTDEIARRSNAPAQLRVFFLRPNVEGLLRDVQACDPTLLPENLERALAKKPNDRDLVFNELKRKAHRDVRECVRKAQPGLDDLARALGTIIPADAIA